MKNNKTLKIGSSNFKMIIEGNHYFVDKTALIYEFFNGSANVSLMTRPRRFGKTLNLSMLDYFFNINNDINKNLFEEFEISKNKDFCEKNQNKYPVINLTLKDIDENNWEDCFEALKDLISKLYKNFIFLLNSEKMMDYEKEIFMKIIRRSAKRIDFKNSLSDLSEYLRKHFNKKVIILVDEYDAPIIKAFRNSNYENEKTYYNNVINFMQTFLGKTFKGNEENLQKGMLTGVMRVGRESIFSKWNNLKVFSITSPYFSDKFGFTEKETKKILKYFSLENNYSGVKKWYDGYTFGDTSVIYNPWSIVNYIAYKEEGFKAHWVNTSSDTLIREKVIEVGIEKDFKKLLSGGKLEKQLHESFVFQDFEKKKELIWTLLTYSGYLTQIKKTKHNNYELKIPNYEVNTLFKDIVVDWFEIKYELKQELLVTTANHLINNRITEFESGFRKIIGNTISYFDKGGEPERIYHVYTLGLLSILSDDYIIKSNGESGDGRYDILLIPFDRTKSGIVIEFKQIKKRHNEKDETFKKRINKSLIKAKEQINENQYYKELIANKIKENNIIKIPIVFAGKNPYINLLK